MKKMVHVSQITLETVQKYVHMKYSFITTQPISFVIKSGEIQYEQLPVSNAEAKS
jgi:hypothetical protein